MKLNYFPETDSLYIDLSENVIVTSREISGGVALDYDASGNLVGIDIDNASTKAEIHKLTVRKLPTTFETVTT
jgi:YD repeat-containing protein